MNPDSKGLLQLVQVKAPEVVRYLIGGQLQRVLVPVASGQSLGLQVRRLKQRLSFIFGSNARTLDGYFKITLLLVA